MAEIGSRTPARVGAFLDVAFPTVAERLLEARIRREWPHLMGPDVSRRCQPGELRNRTLELTVDNSPWLQELALREADLLERLRQRYGPRTVRALKLSLGALSPEPAAAPRRSPRATGRPTAEELQMIDAAVTLIADPELQISARRLLEKTCTTRRPRTGMS
ncbi:MAG: DUF721 domain-containing protein [Candidatus Rokubacteria bacterium]|nr:DUF721 domain-containing protein [Candidatus Rokubacteria bacterium]